MQLDKKAGQNKVISLFTLVMINVIAVDSLRTLPIGAQYGLSLIFYYIIAAIFFFIPTILVTAELATGWPNTGGVYIWVREAFGLRWGFLTIWLQWIYNVVWYPTILAFIAGTLAYMINPHLADSKIYTLSVIMILFWGATLLNCMGMKVSSLVSILGALLGTLLPMAIIIGLGILWIFMGKPTQLTFSAHSFLPDLSNFNNLSFLVAVLFGLMGMEMSAVHAGDVQQPSRDYPRALLYSGLIIITTLICGSLAIAMIIPGKQIGLVAGLIDAYGIFFKAYHLGWMESVIAGLIVVSSLSSVAAWIIGPTRGLWVAAQAGSLPPIFARVNNKGAPVAILLLQGVIFTALCSVFLLMPSVNSTYWILTALTSQLALLFYILMFAAAIKLRYKDAQIQRAYRIPGGLIGIWLVSGCGILACVGTIIVGFLPPTDLHITSVFTYEMILVVGIIVFSIPPFIIDALDRKGIINSNNKLAMNVEN